MALITIYHGDETIEKITRAECIKRGYKIDLTKSEIVALHNKAIRTLARKDQALVVPLKYDSTVADLSAQIVDLREENGDLESTLLRAQAQIKANLNYQARMETDQASGVEYSRNLEAEIARLEGGLKIADAKRENTEALSKIKARTARIKDKRIAVLKTTIESMDRSNVMLRETVDLLRSRKGKK